MNVTTDFNWLESYLDNDALWVDDTLSWDSASTLMLSNYSLYTFLTSSFFIDCYIIYDQKVKQTILDVINFNTHNSFRYTLASNSSKDLIQATYGLNADGGRYEFLWNQMILDMVLFLDVNYISFKAFFYTDYQDFFVTLLHHTPELMLAFNDFTELTVNPFTTNPRPHVTFDFFRDELNNSISEFVESFATAYLLTLALVVFIHQFTTLKLVQSVDAPLVRFQNYLYAIHKEFRVQFEIAIMVFFFAVMYVSMMISMFDDSSEEMVECFNKTFFYMFLFTLAILVWSHSIHLFSFLEAAIREGKSSMVVFKQFCKDMFNVITLVSRFLTLVLRLNIYDTMDDIHDSYYIFFEDFGDDEYLAETFVSKFTFMFFDLDVKDDRSIFLENTLDISADLYSIYFITWSKFALFLLFAVDEIVRVILASYIIFLIIFEVHAVNRSYTEDNYIETKRNNVSTNVTNNL